MRNPCKECDYYHKENNTCQSKKCCTGGYGYITWIDRLFCKPYKYTADRKDEPQTDWETEKRDNSLCYKCVKECDRRVLNRYTIECNQYEPKTEPTISKMEQVETMSCAECKHRPIGAEICEEPCHYEPQTDWHYDEQDATWYPYKHKDEPQTERSE